MLPESWLMEVRQRLSEPPPRRLPAQETRYASVLVPLFVEEGGLSTLLTLRTNDLPHHRNQFAFPGGSRDLGEDSWEAALREAEEEIGLDPKQVFPLGTLDEEGTSSGFRIVPCVGAVPYPMTPRINQSEIAELFSVPLAELSDPACVEEREVKIDGRRRPLVIFHIGERQIWGLTARILQNLLARVGAR